MTLMMSEIGRLKNLALSRGWWWYPTNEDLPLNIFQTNSAGAPGGSHDPNPSTSTARERTNVETVGIWEQLPCPTAHLVGHLGDRREAIRLAMHGTSCKGANG